MPEIEGLEVEHLEPVASSERGQVYEIFRGETARQISIFVREAGEVAGQHYHKGNDPAKDPEKFLVLDGNGLLKARNSSLDEEISVQVGEYTKIEIYPEIEHAIYPKEDMVFLEYRRTEFDEENPDTYPIDDEFEF